MTQIFNLFTSSGYSYLWRNNGIRSGRWKLGRKVSKALSPRTEIGQQSLHISMKGVKGKLGNQGGRKQLL